MPEDPIALVRGYYAALDTHDYDAFENLLAQSFVQHRPDRTFEGRDAFVRFMREDRPMTETRHDLIEVFGANDRVTVRGRLLDGDDDPVFEFADVFQLEADRIVRLDTYTR
ncbi:ketosteroid isomerase-like protein [Halovivax ruber XH-70]|uniref:Ketosteroid isomerase-like protein n=1 Tax=Halovivax ruber (strain DSM 18193 / JCM 13892 / XH-70) TaxID=797302 RepID=L0ICE1_HALRX|nr:nuclear transport factor 2 family protein [Halovivax ruber]AGB17235.1 ketosteroid isomerase-like protein [Halovivax ruber XH-70]